MSSAAALHPKDLHDPHALDVMAAVHHDEDVDSTFDPHSDAEQSESDECIYMPVSDDDGEEKHESVRRRRFIHTGPTRCRATRRHDLAPRRRSSTVVVAVPGDNDEQFQPEQPMASAGPVRHVPSYHVVYSPKGTTYRHNPYHPVLAAVKDVWEDKHEPQSLSDVAPEDHAMSSTATTFDNEHPTFTTAQPYDNYDVTSAFAAEFEPVRPRVMCCYFKQRGTCKMGADCWHGHHGDEHTPCHYGLRCRIPEHRALAERQAREDEKIPWDLRPTAQHFPPMPCCSHHAHHASPYVIPAAPAPAPGAEAKPPRPALAAMPTSTPCNYCHVSGHVVVQEIPVYGPDKHVTTTLRAMCGRCYRTYQL